LLKNRLIYLVSASKDDIRKKNLAREIINENWAIIYEELARNKKSILNDDDFLRLHWLIYFNHEGKNSDKLQKYKSNLLDEVFVKGNFKNSKIYDINFIEKYVISLGNSAKYYFALKNPMFPNLGIGLDVNIKRWISKINKLFPKSHFESLIFAVLIKCEDVNPTLELLKSIEKYLFWTLAIAGIRSNFNKVAFLIETSYYFSGLENVEIKTIIEKLNPILPKNNKKKWVGEKIEIFGNIKDFGEAFRKRQEKNMNQEGFLNWKYLKYFLLEYEAFLSKSPTNAYMPTSNFELIYPPKKELPKRDVDKMEKVKQYIEEREQNWSLLVMEEDKKLKTMHYLCYSLGNIVLNNREAKIEDASSFEDKKEKYKYGTFNQREVCEEISWGGDEILKRGIKLLEFLETRWEITFDEVLKKQILSLSKLKINTGNEFSEELPEQEDNGLFQTD
jgi:hypothetical protein